MKTRLAFYHSHDYQRATLQQWVLCKPLAVTLEEVGFFGQICFFFSFFNMKKFTLHLTKPPRAPWWVPSKV